MYKYWEISKVHMKEQLTWRADVVFNMLFTIVKILFACCGGSYFREKV